MEITALPAPRARRPRMWGLLVIGLLTPVTLLAVLPTMLGLERYIVSSDLGDDLARGTMVFERRVPVGDLEVGDLITYAPRGQAGRRSRSGGPGASVVVTGTRSGSLVTQRVVDLAPGVVSAQGDQREVPGAARLSTRDYPTMSRVELAVPFVGLLFLNGPGWWAWATLAMVAAVTLLVAARRDLGGLPHPRARGALSELVR